uniref:Uncharacterized protein n=1 Tax=Sinocyclocheilus anshuiensis TaxID=1608454 RepID=A0A671RWQ2_9TELE
ISCTSINISIEPDLDGLPPSKAVNTNFMFFVTSLSSGLCNIRIGILPSSRSLISRRKWSLWLSL